MLTARSRQILAEHLRHPPAALGGSSAQERSAATERSAARGSSVAAGYIVISIKPSYARLIAEGSKRVEFRWRFPRRFQSGWAIFYLTSPVRAIAMVARITAVRRGSPAGLWKEFAAVGGASREEFDGYFEGVGSGVALLLDEVRALPAAIGLDDVRLRAFGFKPPQSLAVVREGSALRELVGGL